MIRRGTEEDKRAIFDLYAKSGVLNFDGQEDYFVNSFNSKNIVVNEVNGHVVSSVQVDNNQLMLHGKRLAVGVVCGMFYERSKGSKWFDSLKNEVFKEEQYKNLVTIIPTNNPSEFYKYGFEDVYQQRLYTINKNDLDNASFTGVGRNFKIDELYDIYREFISNFDGYLLRDRDYYVNLITLIQKKKYNLAVYRDVNNKACGYIIYYIESSKVVIREIMYLNGLALTRMLCYCLRLKNNIQVYVSLNEDLSKAFPKIKHKVVTNAVARINDFELFNKLYGIKADGTKTAFYLNECALYFNDLNY